MSSHSISDLWLQMNGLFHYTILCSQKFNPQWRDIHIESVIMCLRGIGKPIKQNFKYPKCLFLGPIPQCHSEVREMELCPGQGQHLWKQMDLGPEPAPTSHQCVNQNKVLDSSLPQFPSMENILEMLYIFKKHGPVIYHLPFLPFYIFSVLTFSNYGIYNFSNTFLCGFQNVCLMKRVISHSKIMNKCTFFYFS